MEIIEKGCTSIFASDESSIKEKFTELWVQIINEKENSINSDIQASSL